MYVRDCFYFSNQWRTSNALIYNAVSAVIKKKFQQWVEFKSKRYEWSLRSLSNTREKKKKKRLMYPSPLSNWACARRRKTWQHPFIFNETPRGPVAATEVETDWAFWSLQNASRCGCWPHLSVIYANTSAANYTAWGNTMGPDMLMKCPPLPPRQLSLQCWIGLDPKPKTETAFRELQT